MANKDEVITIRGVHAAIIGGLLRAKLKQLKEAEANGQASAETNESLLDKLQALVGEHQCETCAERPTVEVTDAMRDAVHDMLEAQLAAIRDFIRAAYGLTHKQAVKVILTDLQVAVEAGEVLLGEE